MVAKERSGVSGGLNKMEIQGFNSSPTICLKGVWVKNIEKFTIKILKFAQNEQTPHFRNVKNIHIFCKSKWKNWNRPKIENRNGASEKTFSYTRLLRITSRTSVCQDIFSAATVETLGHLVQRGYHKNPVKEDYTAYPHFAAWGPILVLGLAETNQKPQVVLTKWRYEDSPLRRRNQPVEIRAEKRRRSSSQVHGNLDEGRRSSEYRAVLPRCGRQKPLRQRRKTPKSPQMCKKSPKNLKSKCKYWSRPKIETELRKKTLTYLSTFTQNHIPSVCPCVRLWAARTTSPSDTTSAGGLSGGPLISIGLPSWSLMSADHCRLSADAGPPTRPPVARPPPPPAHVTVFGKESGYSYTDDSQKRAIFSVSNFQKSTYFKLNFLRYSLVPRMQTNSLS
ncbi:unnamed protein product [Nesidiocoris tenuis]|uniref:Uncharacterized protein n=1 Tax=Nesidiocoris tenuis TaxID=355587 RepID=A0A6H5G6B0_9HEMI|nr:unnamed protein product [Nesidiocoris tenuis]